MCASSLFCLYIFMYESVTIVLYDRLKSYVKYAFQFQHIHCFSCWSHSNFRNKTSMAYIASNSVEITIFWQSLEIIPKLKRVKDVSLYLCSKILMTFISDWLGSQYFYMSRGCKSLDFVMLWSFYNSSSAIIMYTGLPEWQNNLNLFMFILKLLMMPIGRHFV